MRNHTDQINVPDCKLVIQSVLTIRPLFRTHSDGVWLGWVNSVNSSKASQMSLVWVLWAFKLNHGSSSIQCVNLGSWPTCWTWICTINYWQKRQTFGRGFLCISDWLSFIFLVEILLTWCRNQLPTALKTSWITSQPPTEIPHHPEFNVIAKLTTKKVIYRSCIDRFKWRHGNF